jgi:hypothetical protein
VNRRLRLGPPIARLDLCDDTINAASLTEAWKEIVTRRGHFSCRHSYQDHAGSAKVLTKTHGSTRFGTEELTRIEATLRSIEVTSGSSEAWYRARFGTGRSRVRIPPSRPLTIRAAQSGWSPRPPSELCPRPSTSRARRQVNTSTTRQTSSPFKRIEDQLIVGTSCLLTTRYSLWKSPQSHQKIDGMRRDKR